MKIFFLLTILIPVSGMSAVAWEEVFRSLKDSSKKTEILPGQDAPLYRSLQFQYRTQGRDQVEVGGAGRASLKLDLLAWGQREKEKELIKAYGELGKTLGREGASEECLYRSHLLVHAHYLSRYLRLHEALGKNLEDQKALLKRGIGENLFEFRELLSVEDSKLEHGVKYSEAEATAALIEKLLPANTKLNEIDFSNFLPVKAILENGYLKAPREIELEKLRAMASIHSLEFDIEEKKGKQIFDSVELYRWNEQNGFGISYGVQVSFNIPFFNKRNTVKEAVSRQLALNKLSKTERSVIADLDDTHPGLKEKLSRYEALRRSDYLATMKNLIKVLKGNRNTSPLLILKTRAKITEERLKRLALRREISLDYLQGLSSAGKLASCDSTAHLGGH